MYLYYNHFFHKLLLSSKAQVRFLNMFLTDQIEDTDNATRTVSNMDLLIYGSIEYLKSAALAQSPVLFVSQYTAAPSKFNLRGLDKQNN